MSFVTVHYNAPILLYFSPQNNIKNPHWEGRTATSTRTTTATILTGNPSPRLGARWFILAIMPTAVEKTEF